MAGIDQDNSLESLKEHSKALLATDTTENEEMKPLNLTPEGEKEWNRLGCLCQEHLGEVFFYFCLDCNKACCTVCSMKYHHKHNKRLEDVAEGSDGAFGHTGIFFPPDFTVEGILKELNEDLQGIDIRAENSKEQIKACVEKHKAKIESSKKDLVDHVTAVKKARLKFLKEQQKHLKKNLDSLIGVVGFMKEHLDSDDQFSILLAEKEITRRVAELNEKCSRMSLPSEQDWNLDQIKVVRDGKYVQAPQRLRPTHSQAMQGGKRNVNDFRFNTACAKVEFDMDKEVMQNFVKLCHMELIDKQKSWLDGCF